MSCQIEQDHDRSNIFQVFGMTRNDCILQSSICGLEAFDLALAAAGGLCQRLRFWFVTQRWNKNIALNGFINLKDGWRMLKNTTEGSTSLVFQALSRNVTSHLNHRFSAEALLLYSWSDDAYFGQSWNLQAFRSECTTIVCFALHCRLWRVMTTASHVTECHDLIWICIISCHVMSCHDSLVSCFSPF